jgi:predicted transcriptional regulator
MTPNEVNSLRKIEKNGGITKRKLAPLVGVTTEYAGYLLECLDNSGYLEKEDRGMYLIAPKGIDALIVQLLQIESKLKARMEWCLKESERIELEIDRLIDHKTNLIAT